MKGSSSNNKPITRPYCTRHANGSFTFDRGGSGVRVESSAIRVPNTSGSNYSLPASFYSSITNNAQQFNPPNFNMPSIESILARQEEEMNKHRIPIKRTPSQEKKLEEQRKVRAKEEEKRRQKDKEEVQSFLDNFEEKRQQSERNRLSSEQKEREQAEQKRRELEQIKQKEIEEERRERQQLAEKESQEFKERMESTFKKAREKSAAAFKKAEEELCEYYERLKDKAATEKSEEEPVDLPLQGPAIPLGLRILSYDKTEIPGIEIKGQIFLLQGGGYKFDLNYKNTENGKVLNRYGQGADREDLNIAIQEAANDFVWIDWKKYGPKSPILEINMGEEVKSKEEQNLLALIDKLPIEGPAIPLELRVLSPIDETEITGIVIKGQIFSVQGGGYKFNIDYKNTENGRVFNHSGKGTYREDLTPAISKAVNDFLWWDWIKEHKETRLIIETTMGDEVNSKESQNPPALIDEPQAKEEPSVFENISAEYKEINKSLENFKGNVIDAIDDKQQQYERRLEALDLSGLERAGLYLGSGGLAATSMVADLALPESIEGLAVDALLLATGTKGLKMSYQAAHRIAEARKLGKSLGADPFKGRTFSQIDKRLMEEGFDVVGNAPIEGEGAYFHPISGRKYHLDKGGLYRQGLEKSHVDVHRKNILTGESVEEVPELPANSTLTTAKRKYPLGEQLLDPTIRPPKQTPKLNK